MPNSTSRKIGTTAFLVYIILLAILVHHGLTRSNMNEQTRKIDSIAVQIKEIQKDYQQIIHNDSANILKLNQIERKMYLLRKDS